MLLKTQRVRKARKGEGMTVAEEVAVKWLVHALERPEE